MPNEIRGPQVKKAKCACLLLSIPSALAFFASMPISSRKLNPLAALAARGDFFDAFMLCERARCICGAEEPNR
jgi:hypothetical protein